MLISELPVELLSHILSYIPRQDLYECMRVCKLWCRRILPAYYREIHLHRHHDIFYQYSQKSILSEQYHIGSFVQTLIFANRKSATTKKLTRLQFEHLIANLPHLQTIRFTSPKNTHLIAGYMQFLNSILSGSTHIQEVSIPKFNEYDKKIKNIYQFHYTINQQLKQQITTLSHYDLRIKALEGDCSVVLNYLKEFVELRQLTLSNMDTERGIREGIHTTSILEVCDNLRSLHLENTFTWFVGKKHHSNLTSLSLVLPNFSADHLGYLVDYVPNLIELSLTIWMNTLSDVYASIDSRMAAHFTTYLKKLQRLQIHSACENRSQDDDFFWNTICGIYDGRSCGNIQIQVSDREGQMEVIDFDRQLQTFNINYQWHLFSLDRLPSLTFDFFKLNSIQIEDFTDYYTIYDLLDMLLLDKHIQLHIKCRGQTVLLTTKQLGAKIRIPQKGSIVKFAKLENIDLKDNILNKIGTFYPTVSLIFVRNCKVPKEHERTNHYILNLRRFGIVQKLMFDFDVTLGSKKRTRPIYLQFITEDVTKFYYYRQTNDLTNVVYPVGVPETNLPKSVYIIKIKSVDLRSFIFWRRGIKMQIVAPFQATF